LAILDFGLEVSREGADVQRSNQEILAEGDSMGGMELLADSGILPPHRLTALRKEADELIAMTVASMKTLRNRK
jgi:hypothetical protein